MALTTAQIESLLRQARSDGAGASDIEAMRMFLLDRAADMNGAQRLAMANELQQPDVRGITNTFVSAAASIRGDIMARGAAAVSTITDAEWDAILGEGEQNGQGSD